MIHIHGGGFVAMSSSSHQNYLIPWAKQLQIPVFSIDYRLAPEVQYPDILDDCINGYLWIIVFIEQVLKVPINTLILTGDSAGGNISCVITNWCIINGVRKPDYIFPHYPVCNMYMKSYSPCYMFSLDEPLLNYTILKMCSKYYIPEGADPKDDCYLSPLTTPNEILKEYPDMAIGICEYDPLRDDEFRLVRRLLHVEVEVDVKYVRFMPHGLLNLAIRRGLPEAFAYLNCTIETFRKFLSKRKKLYNYKNPELSSKL